MLQFIHVFTFCFAVSVHSACSLSLLLFWKICFIVFPSDPRLNMYIFSLVYVRHQFLIPTAFHCTVIQTLKSLRWKRNCQAMTHLTKVKESQRSLLVSGMELWFPQQRLILCGSLKGMKRQFSGKLLISFEKFFMIQHSTAKSLDFPNYLLTLLLPRFNC